MAYLFLLVTNQTKRILKLKLKRKNRRKRNRINLVNNQMHKNKRKMINKAREIKKRNNEYDIKIKLLFKIYIFHLLLLIMKYHLVLRDWAKPTIFEEFKVFHY